MKRIVSFFGEDSEVFRDLNKRAKDYARSRNLEYQWAIQQPFCKESVIANLREADAGIIDIEPYGEDIFSQIGARTKILVRFGVGYDKVDLDAATAHRIAVARTVGANTNAVAEMALMLLLASRRRLFANTACVREHQWEKLVSHETIGSTVGIVGFGAVGRRLARLLKGFDCKILVYMPRPNDAALEEAGAELVSLEELFERSDAISIHAAYNKETANMIDEHLLRLMKPSAVLVNTSRGGIVDEEALCRVLTEHSIAGAGFDVFLKEPLLDDSPLRELDSIILTPHASSQTYESLWNIYKMAIDIIADYFEGKQSPCILNTF
ncbi:MAG: phosphoglycerate dehydrogenase [Bacillota bacterium]|nr:phosphoglycerate dehydrogenase [Bacillota bacterium]